MSRSYKKKNIVKDKDRGSQKVASKAVRRITKGKLKVANPEEEILPEKPSEVIDSYDVTDWKFTDAKGRGKNKKVNK